MKRIFRAVRRELRFIKIFIVDPNHDKTYLNYSLLADLLGVMVAYVTNSILLAMFEVVLAVVTIIIHYIMWKRIRYLEFEERLLRELKKRLEDEDT